MRTALLDKLGIQLPIIQAPMGGAGCPELAAAVSNAGGLGMLALWTVDLDGIRRQIRETKALTQGPFGVNLNLTFDQQERLAACLEEGVAIISLFWGDPAPLVGRIHEAGALVLHTAPDATDARQAVEAGVDIIVAQGWEAGGHVLGQMTSLSLIPSVVDAVAPTPVVAAGGIADGRGLAAVLTLGASGAWIGTRFLAAKEAAIHPRYRELLLKATGTDTVYTRLFDGGWPNAPHRVLRNSTVRMWEAAGAPRPAADLARERYWRPRRRAANSSGTGQSHRARMRRATLRPFRCGLARVLSLSSVSKGPPRSCMKSSTRRGQCSRHGEHVQLHSGATGRLGRVRVNAGIHEFTRAVP